MTPEPTEFNTSNLVFIETLYEQFLQNAESVDAEWRAYFGSLSQTNGVHAPRKGQFGPSFQPRSIFRPVASGNGASSSEYDTLASLQHRVELLVRNYRVRAHRVAQVNPLETVQVTLPELQPEYYGFTEAHMDMRFETDFLGGQWPTLREIIESAKNTYARSIGAQFMHIDDLDVREWLQRRMEQSENRLELTREDQLRILTRLTDATIFEEFIQKKFIGAKSFSLEGGETLIPLLEDAIEQASEHGVEEILVGMPHRGRLNVLTNIMGKNPRKIFREFEDSNPELNVGRGDVKYHLGYHCDWTSTAGKNIHLALTFNPSHLEYVNVVALGRMRAKNDRDGDHQGKKGMVILMHGDAAFAGEGIVQETLNLSRLPGYQTGGTLHIIVNNQIGFTTVSEDSRSTTYASDVAKMLQTPIFHVNGEDPEAVAQSVRLALDFRHTYQRDVIIDMYCYRRRGHNEGDEPSFTQPLMYKAIQAKEPVREGYLKHLLKLGGVTQAEADDIAEKRRQNLEIELTAARSGDRIESDLPSGPSSGRPTNVLRTIWSQYRGGPDAHIPEVDTHFPEEQLKSLMRKLSEVPRGFTPHPKLQRILEGRREMAEGTRPLDWAAAEGLAIASLAVSGHRVRLTGQDSQRGTFSHRHSVLHDYNTGKEYHSFKHLAEKQAAVDIYNSPLSEAGVLGFEYGYSVGYPDGLIMWEAQFGDFANVAQVIFDQFIASAEDKWRRLTNLVLLLPHGLEGTGPEHASARLERFMNLAAEDNIQVIQPSTPAQYFHALRRQVLRPWRKPLIVMSPKSMLRHSSAVSEISELSTGGFSRILPELLENPEGIDRVILCAGKIYYDLIAKRAERNLHNVAIIRLEQFYPFDDTQLYAALSPFKDGAKVCWTQEEPENMGAWRFLYSKFGSKLFGRFPFSGVFRPASASPATGSSSSHKLEQAHLIRIALGVVEEDAT